MVPRVCPLQALQTVASSDELKADPKVKEAVLSMLMHILYTPLAYDQAAVQDEAVQLAGAWAGADYGSTTLLS